MWRVIAVSPCTDASIYAWYEFWYFPERPRRYRNPKFSIRLSVNTLKRF